MKVHKYEKHIDCIVIFVVTVVHFTYAHHNNTQQNFLKQRLVLYSILQFILFKFFKEKDYGFGFYFPNCALSP